MGQYQPEEPEGKHPADAPARRSDPEEELRPPRRGSVVTKTLALNRQLMDGTPRFCADCLRVFARDQIVYRLPVRIGSLYV